jgi:carbamoyl-phosphate synthase large subunit
MSVNDDDKHHIVGMVRELLGLGFEVVATSGTASYLQDRSLTVTKVNKVREGRPHIVDMLVNGNINLVINTTKGEKSIADSFSIRRTALSYKVPYNTTIRGANAAIMAIKYIKKFKKLKTLSLQECVKQLNSFKI